MSIYGPKPTDGQLGKEYVNIPGKGYVGVDGSGNIWTLNSSGKRVQIRPTTFDVEYLNKVGKKTKYDNYVNDKRSERNRKRYSTYNTRPYRVLMHKVNGKTINWDAYIPGKGNIGVREDGRLFTYDTETGDALEVLPTSYDLQHLNAAGFHTIYDNGKLNNYQNKKPENLTITKPNEIEVTDSSKDTNTGDQHIKPTKGTGNTRSKSVNGRSTSSTGVNVTPRDAGRSSTQIPTQTSSKTYTYNFGKYYTDNPNGDKSNPVANDYFNADKYSNRIDAFKAAQDAGHGVFTWRGKAYNTMDKGDDPLEFRRKHSDYDAFIGRAHMKNGDDGIDNSGGWSGSKNYNRDNVFNNQQINPITASQANNNTLVSYNQQSQTPKTPQRTRLQKFTDDDIRSLGFNNYQGLLNAANNSNNSNNRFLQSMYDRYGSDTSKWNQATIENDLGVKGKYRRFGGGDFGDMSRSMMAWIGKNNGEIDKQNLQNRTGSNGTVYSSKEMKDLFEKYDPKKQQSIQIPATQTNTSTPSNTQNQQTTSQQSGNSNYKFPTNQNNNTFSGNYLNPYSNFGYALSHYKKFQKGGTINMEEQQLQQAFLQYLMQQTGAKDQQQLEQVIQQLGEEGLKQAYSKFLQEMQQQQVQAAKFGAKLNYIRRLNGQCPDGTEMTYFKVGGKLCKKCMQVKQNRKEQENESDNPINAFKCGRKIRKNQNGRKFPLIETDKNGKNRTKYYKDEATRDSIAVNRYNDQDIQVNKPGSYKKNAKGKVQWTPDRTKAPYKKN